MRSDILPSLRRLPDDELLARLKQLAAHERGATALLVAHLAELDTRDAHLREGHPSLFAYCRDALALSEHEAYNRIEAARAARRFPLILGLLEEGALNLTAVRLLAPHLTERNHRSVLESVRGKRKPEVEEIVARLSPRPDAPTTVRKLPAHPVSAGSIATMTSASASVGSAASADQTPATASLAAAAPAPPTSAAAVPVPGASAEAVHPSSTAPAPCPASSAPVRASSAAAIPRAEAPDVTASAPTPAMAPSTVSVGRSGSVAPLAADRYKLQVTIGGDTLAMLRRAQDLLRHAIPNGDEAAILHRALGALLADLSRNKLAATDAPRRSRAAAPGSRHIPAAVRRAVWRRDLGRCAFVGTGGRRCPERAFMELHHVRPYAAGGEATVDNIQLRCRRHNQCEARTYFAPVREYAAGALAREEAVR